MDTNILIDNIRMLCKKNKVSISKLESDLFYSSGLISRWNKSMPSLDKIMEIAEYFGVTIDELVGHSNNNTDPVTVKRFLTLLYNRSMTAEVKWDILNFEDPPKEFSQFTPLSFFPSKSCDCYFTEFMHGFFFLAATHTPKGELLLSLYVLPDIYSKLERILSDTEQLTLLYEYLSRLLSKQMNTMKTNNLINAFMQNAEEAVSPANEKITPLRSVSEASNY